MDKNLNIVLSEGQTEVVLREGVAAKVIDPKPPVKTKIAGTIGAPVEYLQKRIGTAQFTQERSHLIVNRECISLSLIINEDDEYTRGEVHGKLEYNPKFQELGINQGKKWTPVELGLTLKMNRALFADLHVNMKIVSELMNFTAKVNNSIQRLASENGNRIDNFEQVVESNLPKSFFLKMPIFKGCAEETIEIETFASINGRDVGFMLISPAASAAQEDMRNRIIDKQLEAVKEIAPNIAIIEV
jgi:hypothetical protein